MTSKKNMPPKKTILITPHQSFFDYWCEAWSFRHLLILLTWRDIIVRYKQTVLGVAWAVIRPILTMVILTVIFGRLANLPSDGIPYPLLVFVGTLAWQFCSSTFSDMSLTLLNNIQIVTKIYVPRVILLFKSILVTLVDFSLTFVIFLCVAAWYGFLPDWHIVFLPFFLLLLCLFSLACGLWISALNVLYRDFTHIIPFMIQLGTYASPVGFTSSVIPDQWRLVYALNPMVGIIDGFRWCLLKATVPLHLPSLWISIIVTLIILLGGLQFFRSLERKFADVI